MPRPDLSELLGVTYRRIPLLSIGGDIFADTRLIIAELGRRFPKISPEQTLSLDPSNGVLTKFLDDWTDEIFASAVKLLPKDLPLMKDPNFLKDRADFSGRSFSNGKVEDRKEALANVRTGFIFLENKLLHSTQKWLLGQETPTILDLLAVWPFDWLISLPGALHGSDISASGFPLTFDWIKRFNQLLKKVPSLKSIETVTGKEAKRLIMSADNNNMIQFDDKDPLNLRKGDLVEVVPTDSGVNHPQEGVLCGLEPDRVVLNLSVPGNEATIKIHFPRARYNVRPIAMKRSNL